MTLHDHPQPAARHARRRPLPGSVFAFVTLVAWSMAVTATLVSAFAFGMLANELWVFAIVWYLVGIFTLPQAWRRG